MPWGALQPARGVGDGVGIGTGGIVVVVGMPSIHSTVSFPGLGLFLALFVSLFRTAGRVRRMGARVTGTRDVAVAAGSVQVALVAFAVAAFFHPVAYQFYFFLAAGLALAVQNVLRAEMPAPARQAA